MRTFLWSLVLGSAFALADDVRKYKITKDVDESDVRLQKYFYCLDDQMTELEKFIRSSTPEIRTFKEVKIRLGDPDQAADHGGVLKDDGRTLILNVQPGGGVPPPGASVKSGCEFWTASKIRWFLKEAHLKKVEGERYERTYEKQNRKRTPKVDGRAVEGNSAGAASAVVPPVPEALAPAVESAVPAPEVKAPKREVAHPLSALSTPAPESTPTAKPSQGSDLETVPVTPPAWSQ